MRIDIGKLVIGEEYTRPNLAELWGYRSHNAISRGVVTPKDGKIIILFVTHEKQESLTQYNDYIDGDLLFWEGEEKHGSDDRVIGAAQNGDQVYLFYRDRHHAPFVYMGEVFLDHFERLTDAPSRFIFRIGTPLEMDDALVDLELHRKEYETLPETERDAVRNSRVGQGRFRNEVVRLWGACAVTGIPDTRVLLASHVKPWKAATNAERLDPYNGLLLAPNLDKLFDQGFVTFDESGAMVRSGRLERTTYRALAVDSGLKLRRKFPQCEPYLDYHREHVYKG